MYTLPTLFVIGGLIFIVIGVIGQLEIKEMKVGTKSKASRIIISIVGVGLLITAVFVYRSDPSAVAGKPMTTNTNSNSATSNSNVGFDPNSNETIFQQAIIKKDAGDVSSINSAIKDFDLLATRGYKIAADYKYKGEAYFELSKLAACEANLENAFNAYERSIQEIQGKGKPDDSNITEGSVYLARSYANEKAGHLEKALEDNAKVCKIGHLQVDCETANENTERVSKQKKKEGPETKSECSE